ncbi:UBX domain-containing protein 10 [Sporothrix eucalyptigena]|uniref:UBX domain-containing protein 10 n=1 Tax=Sporothrix eucalyptigena TaxID=1812306 RepID=A0ABP0BF87_9PEZI
MARPGPIEPAGAADRPTLTEEQQEAIRQFITLTNEDAESAEAYLRRSGWSVTVGVSKFFDGDGPTMPDLDNLPPPPPQSANNQPQRLIDLGDPLGGFQGTGPGLHDVLEQARYAAANNRRMIERTEPARRIVVTPPAPVVQPSFFTALLLSPLSLGFRVLSGLWRTVTYILGLVPGLSAFRRMASGAPAAPRRYLKPRDAASRFKREFEEATGSKALPFVEMGYTQAYDKAKTEPKFLVIVLMSPEHDDTKSYARDTLLHPDVVEFINNPANNIMLWGGSVRDPEAYQVSLEHRVTKFPFMAMICVTPKEGGSTRMGTVKRVVGPVSATYFLEQLRLITTKYADDLAAVRAVRVANEATRNIRIEQDNAYERSLAIDRERARQRQEAERLAREREAEAERQEKLSKQWRAWRKANLAPEPAVGTSNIVRVALKLPQSLGGERVRRSFADDATVEDLYAFVECYNVTTDDDAEEAESSAVNEKVAKPEGYTHKYGFRIASMMPREVHEPSEDKTLLEAIGKSASLVVEEVEESESGEESGDEDAN